ncbi:hypothetical protein ACFWSP_35370 [Streptomyces sp. NPDC058618]|uniref:hypothetical protein n=1 Tax=Streptomyces sp. NPDC058618 TaxID=3346558 RepID=UPI00364EB4DF
MTTPEARMGRKKLKPRRAGHQPPAFGIDVLRELTAAWDSAVAAGLMTPDTEVNYRALQTGNPDVISDAIGTDGQLLVDGRELTPAWAAELRRTKPLFAELIDFYVQQSAAWTRISDMPPCEHASCDCASCDCAH